MKVKCYNCGLVREAVLGEGACPECGFHKWYSLPEEKIRESDMVSLAKEFLRVIKEEGIKIVKKEEVTDETMMEVEMKARAKREKEEGLAFVIFDIVDQKKVNVRKIYINSHIEGFEGNPIIVNHIFPKINALKYFAQSINEEYRKFIIRCIASDFYPIENLNVLYKKFKETIEKI